MLLFLTTAAPLSTERMPESALTRRTQMTNPKIDMIGKVFGRLQVMKQVDSPKENAREAWYFCHCQCGNSITTRGTSLRRGITTSCGCLRKEVTRKRNEFFADENYNLSGKRFHSLVVIESVSDRRSGSRVWKCICDCGNIHHVTTHNLISGNVKSCGCRPSREPENLKGKRFGRLTVLELTEHRKSNGAAVWRCQCDCGNELTVSSSNLKRGATASCGCIRRENLANMQFGKLTVLRLGEKSNKGNGSFWICQCECGKQCEVQGNKLKSGHTSSCGCSHIINLSGQIFGKLTVLHDSGKRRSGSGGVIWTCQCECGQQKDIRQDALLSGSTISCGCLKSRGNEKVAKILRDAGIDFIPEYSPPNMEGRKRFDFAVLENGNVAYFIEYDGILHSEYSNSGWDTEERFKRTQTSDKIKNEYCRVNSIPLIRIPYTKFDRLSLNDLLLNNQVK